MAFDMFKKKKEVVDFRPKDSDMPIPTKMRERLLAGRPSLATSPVSSDSSSTNSSSTGSGGGFFSFFGGGSDSTSSPTTSSSSLPSSSSGSFWDATPNSSSTNSSSYNSGTTLEKLETSLNDLLYRFSRLIDRVELLEKKMDRVERKDNPSGGY